MPAELPVQIESKMSSLKGADIVSLPILLLNVRMSTATAGA